MYSFIVNPNARSGLGRSVWDELEIILKEKQVSYQIFFTEYKGHATDITRKLTSDGEEHTIVALGGDGTVNEVVNGIVHYDKTILGYIPLGSGNDFARGLGIQTKPKDALRTVLTCPHLHPMNIGELRYKNKLRKFAVSFGIGFDADICHETMVSRLKYWLNKLKLGKLVYVCCAIHRLFLTKPGFVTVTLDQERELVFPKTYFVAVMNNRYEGGGVKFCPKAQNNDDMLDVIVVNKMPKLKILLLFPTAFAGLHVHFKGVHIYQAKSIEILSEHALPVHTDGEPIFLQRDVSVCCAPKKIRVITPKSI